MEWISVKDRLPEIPKGRHAVSVIVAEWYDNKYDVCCCMFRKGYFYDLGWGQDCTTKWYPIVMPITHWMPMPDPPSEDA